MIRKLIQKTYELAFIESCSGDITDGNWLVHKVKNPYKSKWFADPFILSSDDKNIFVLVEEMDYHIRRGRIAKLTICKDTYEITGVKILLDLDTHLSFPAIWREGNNIYVYPENSKNGKLSIYTYDVSEDIFIPQKFLIEQPLTDSIMRNIDGEKYLFSTKLPVPNGNILYVYKQNRSNQFVEFQVINFDNCQARGAGDWFIQDGSTIRPAQNCNGYYGVGLIFQKVEIDANGTFSFSEISRVGCPKGYDGMHTFNTFEGLTIIDYRRPIHPIIYYCLKKISNFFNK